MREMAGGLGMRLAMALLAGLGLAFSEAPNAKPHGDIAYRTPAEAAGIDIQGTDR